MSAPPDPCGPWEKEGLNKLIPQDPFREACLVHDEHYEHPGEMSRAEADRIFLRDMLASSRHLWDRLRAYGMYAAVRLGGWRYYRAGK